MMSEMNDLTSKLAVPYEAEQTGMFGCSAMIFIDGPTVGMFSSHRVVSLSINCLSNVRRNTDLSRCDVRFHSLSSIWLRPDTDRIMLMLSNLISKIRQAINQKFSVICIFLLELKDVLSKHILLSPSGTTLPSQTLFTFRYWFWQRHTQQNNTIRATAWKLGLTHKVASWRGP